MSLWVLLCDGRTLGLRLLSIIIQLNHLSNTQAKNDTEMYKKKIQVKGCIVFRCFDFEPYAGVERVSAFSFKITINGLVWITPHMFSIFIDYTSFIILFKITPY